MKPAPLTAEERAGEKPVVLERAARHVGCRYTTLLEAAKSGLIRAYLPPGKSSGWKVYMDELKEDMRGRKAEVAEEGRRAGPGGGRAGRGGALSVAGPVDAERRAEVGGDPRPVDARGSRREGRGRAVPDQERDDALRRALDQLDRP